MVITAFTEQTVMDYAMDVQLVKQWIAVLKKSQQQKRNITSRITNLRDRRSKHNNFVKLAHSFHKGVHTWPLNDIHIMILTFDFHGNRKVGLV